MQSFLIISSDKKQRELFAQTICDEHHINPFDRTVIIPEKSIGIEDVRTMQKTVFLKPFKSEKKAVIIHDAQTATIETQNALLKLLEEPPQNTLLILSATSEEAFLPTVISRCNVITLEKQATQVSQELHQVIQEDFYSLMQGSIGIKLKKAQDMAKEKDAAITWLGELIQVIRMDMLENLDFPYHMLTYITVLTALQHAFATAKKTNVNLRFLLEDMLLQLSVTHAALD